MFSATIPLAAQISSIAPSCLLCSLPFSWSGKRDSLANHIAQIGSPWSHTVLKTENIFFPSAFVNSVPCNPASSPSNLFLPHEPTLPYFYQPTSAFAGLRLKNPRPHVTDLPISYFSCPSSQFSNMNSATTRYRSLECSPIIYGASYVEIHAQLK